MKTRFYTYCGAAMVLMSVFGCTKDPEMQPKKELTIVAATDGEIYKEWKAGDKIKVVYEDELYTFAASKNGKTADFIDPEKKLSSDMLDGKPVYAYFNCSNMYGGFKIQAEQTYGAGVVSADIPMYAYTMNIPENNILPMTFKPLSSVFRISLSPYDIEMSKLTIRPAEGATFSSGAMAGTFKVDVKDGSVSVSTEINSIIVDFAAPVSLSQGFAIDVPTGWFAVEGGLELVVTYDYTKEYVQKIWTDDGVVKSYDDNGGILSSKVLAEAIVFDHNAFPRNYYVTTTGDSESMGLSWDAPTTLASALENAVSGSTVHVAAGTYNPETYLTYKDGDNELAQADAFKSFAVTSNISIIGGYPASPNASSVADSKTNATILDGKGISHHTVVVAAPKVPGETVVLDGLTIKGGASDENVPTTYKSVFKNGGSLAANYAAGIGIIGSEIEMKNVKVSENNGHSAAGLYCINSAIKMTDCSVSDNVSAANGAGAWFTTGTELVMDGCEISGNLAKGIAGGLYLYVPKDASMKAEVRNTVISNNKATKDNGATYNNKGGLYVRDDSEKHGLESSFENCTFDGNMGNMGASAATLNANTSFTGCIFKNNSAKTGNGQIYVETSGTGKSEVVFASCNIFKNYGKGLGAGIYAYNNGGGIDILVSNTSIYENETAGRGGALYVRNNQAAPVKAICVNSTFANNRAGSWGGAINIYGADGKPSTVDLISCTVTGNITTNATAYGGISLETPGTTLNTYNSIIAGNKLNEEIKDVVIKSGVTATVAHKYTFVGDKYFNASCVEETVTPVFDYSTMLNALNNGVCTLAGDNNPALTKGMSVADLKALAKGTLTADILGSDCKGAARTGNIAGACVSK